MELSAGELDQMYSTYSADQTKEKYFKRIYKKTASLFTTASIISIEKNPIENPIIQFLDDPSNNSLLSKAIENASEKSNISEALKIAEQFCKTALNEIKFLPENSHKIALIDLVDYVLTRDK